MRKVRIAATAMLLSVMATGAMAMPIVITDNPRVAVEIQNLDILGTLYNVTFNNVGDGTFAGNIAGANAARDAINAALNTSTAEFVRVLNTGGSVNNFGVMVGASTVRGVSFSIAGNWQASSNTALRAPIAQFVLAPTLVPEPGTLGLIGLALFGLAAARRKQAAEPSNPPTLQPVPLPGELRPGEGSC